MNEHDTDYKPGDRIEVRDDEQSPWSRTGTVVGDTLPAFGTNALKQWMVKVDGEHGATAMPAIRIRRAP